MAALPRDATIDGEAAMGVANFELLHSRQHDRRAFLYAFDLLELDGLELRPFPLERRKDQLRICCSAARAASSSASISRTMVPRSSPTPAGLAARALSARTARVSYKSGPSKTWIKVKNPEAPGVQRFVRDDDAPCWHHKRPGRNARRAARGVPELRPARPLPRCAPGRGARAVG